MFASFYYFVVCKVATNLELNEKLRDVITEMLLATEKSLNRTGMFDRTVMVEHGVYRTAEEIESQTESFNRTAYSALTAAGVHLKQIEAFDSTIRSYKNRSNEALQLVMKAKEGLEAASNDTNTVNIIEADFTSVYENNTQRLNSLTAERNSLNSSFRLYLGRSQNATVQVAASSVVARMAYQVAQASVKAASKDKADADQLLVDSTTLMDQASSVYNNATVLKVWCSIWPLHCCQLCHFL